VILPDYGERSSPGRIRRLAAAAETLSLASVP
jgi:hypothetical protein